VEERLMSLRFSQKRLRSADDLIRQFRRWFPSTRWMFRGHANARWLPTSSLDRYCSDFGFPARKKAVVESFLLQDFYRHLSAHEPGLPVTSDLQLLLALMQHHGTPTRMIDWTYSPFIATYIALEAARGDAAVWALNGEWLEREASRVVDAADVIGRGRYFKAAEVGAEKILLRHGLFNKKGDRLGRPFVLYLFVPVFTNHDDNHRAHVRACDSLYRVGCRLSHACDRTCGQSYPVISGSADQTRSHQIGVPPFPVLLALVGLNAVALCRTSVRLDWHRV
jgi:hypothetical protein